MAGGHGMGLWQTYIVLVVWTGGSMLSASEDNAERVLYKHLTRFLDPSARPVLRGDQAIRVNISIQLNTIKHLVEKNQTLQTSIWLFEEWQDEVLQWNPKRYANIDTMVMRPDKIWTPDIYVYNNAGRGTHGYINVASSLLLVHHTGKIHWRLPVTTQSLCAVDVTYFPYDNQRCEICFGSWLYDDTQLELFLSRRQADLSQYATNSQFHLKSVSLKLSTTKHNVTHGFHGLVTMALHIRRRPLYYLYTIIAPTLVLCILTVFSFALPCDNGEKVGIGLTVFLSLYVLQSNVAENIPEPNLVPLLGLFLILVMTLIATSLLCATLVMNLKKKGDRSMCVAVPRILLVICRDYLARMTFTSLLTAHDIYDSCQGEPSYNDNREDATEPPATTRTNDTPDSCNARRKARHKCNRVASSPTDNHHHHQHYLTHHHHLPHHLHHHYQQQHQQQQLHDHLPNHQHHRTLGDENTSSTAMTNRAKWQMRMINNKLEWYFVAEVVDKFLCMLFIVTMCVLVGVSLIVIPYVHRDD